MLLISIDLPQSIESNGRYHHAYETLLGPPDVQCQQLIQCIYFPVLHGSSSLGIVSQS